MDWFNPLHRVWLSKKFGLVDVLLAADASQTHDHQKISFSNIMPQRYFNNFSFMLRNRQPCSEYMLRANPQRLMVRDFGHAVLIVPHSIQGSRRNNMHIGFVSL